MAGETLKIGMADLKVSKAPDKLTTLGLGSCVGVTLYDKSSKVVGMVHVMLPSSKDIKNNENKAKFADTGIELLVERMMKLGATKAGIVAKIAGGSQMFNFNSNNETLKVGERNVAATKMKLKEMGIRLVAEDTGGNFGRTIVINSEDGSLHVRTIGHGEKTI